MSTPYLDSLRARFGLRRKITREELRDFLVLQATNAGLDLAGHSGWYGAADTDAPEEIARAVANAPQGITVLSLGGHVRDIQRDDPGSMHPMQYAELSFVSEALARGDHDSSPHSGSTMEYLRRRATRVIAVTGEALQPRSKPAPAEAPHKSPYYCPSCGKDVMAEDRDTETKCPVCATVIGEYFL